MFAENGSPRFQNCTITKNEARGGSFPYTLHSGGGGVYVSGGTPIFEDCVISDNETRSWSTSVGGGEGAGLKSRFSSVTLKNCSITGNQTNYHGAGVYHVGDPTAMLTLDNCTVADNRASGQGNGGGLYLKGPAEITESAIARNEAAMYGGGDSRMVRWCMRSIQQLGHR